MATARGSNALTMRRFRFWIIAIAVCLAGALHGLAAPSRAVKLQCPENGTRAVSFAEAIDGATFRASDGSEIRLSGVIAQGARGETPSPRNAERAREALAAHLKSGPLTLAASTTDRYGRTLAHVFADGMWVQALMLRQGEARVSPDLLGDGCATALLRAEDEGRRANAGHWSDHPAAAHLRGNESSPPADAGLLGGRLGGRPW